MPDPTPPDRDGARTRAERAADHAGIDRLAAELLPSLIAKLGATGLGELEVREGAWRVRLRRPADGAPATGAARGRAERGGDRHGDRHARGGHHPPASPAGTGTRDARDGSRRAATAPAVGVYRPRTDLAAGDRVRAGDRLGAVDMLGVAQEVVAPIDGIVGASLAESGDAVEYGQELLVIEALTAPTPTGATDGASGANDVP